MVSTNLTASELADQALVRKVASAIASGDIKPIAPLLTPAMNAALTQDVVAKVKKELFDPRGSIKSVTILSQVPAGDVTKVTFVIGLDKGTINGVMARDDKQMVSGFFVSPGASESYAAYVTKAPVHLPFAGSWFVGSGGPDPKKNHHAGNRAQNYAYDFVIVKNGTTHTGEGSSNKDYFAYDQPVLSPISGTVAVLVDGVPENQPGEMNPYYAFGNSVVIRDEFNEYAVIAHFVPGSFRVKVGQHIAAGDVLGLCGNSGNSSEPHIHFHLQNGINIADADGLPITFQDFVEDNKSISSGQLKAHITVANGH